MEYYAIYNEEAGLIFGIGDSEEAAWKDAKRELNNPETLDGLTVHRCTKRLFNAVKANGGGIDYETKGNSILDLPLTPIWFTDETEDRIIDWLKNHVKADYAETIVSHRSAWLDDVYNSVCDYIPGHHEPEYELRSYESASGKPELLSFTENDFAWEDRNEDRD